MTLTPNNNNIIFTLICYFFVSTIRETTAKQMGIRRHSFPIKIARGAGVS